MIVNTTLCPACNGSSFNTGLSNEWTGLETKTNDFLHMEGGVVEVEVITVNGQEDYFSPEL